MTDWAIPQQAKLKYTQLFNLHDRSRGGYLSGLQCRDILLQSGLPRNVLAEIWNLSDIDGDGQLTREEFILAMHLTNHVRSGQSLPAELPADLIPPSYRRTRSISATSIHSAASAGSSVSGNNDDQVSQKSPDNMTSFTSGSVLNSNSFEDKRRENFEKGRAELERRRLKMMEQQSGVLKEHLATSKKQVTEVKAKIDSMRTERDAKMGLITSLEAQLKALRDKKAYLHHEELSLIVIAKDLNLVNPTQAELDHLATQAKQQSINQMKEKLGEFLKEKEERARELVEVTGSLEEFKKQLKSISETVNRTYENYKEKVANAKIMRAQFLNENKSQTPDLDSVWGTVPSFGNHPGSRLDSTALSANEDPWATKPSAVQPTAFTTLSTNNEDRDPLASSNSNNKSYDGNGSELKEFKHQVKRYRALYAFEARNPDELTINLGDIIIGSEEVCEPGWLSGKLNGRVGLFPEAYVELFVEQINEALENSIQTGQASTFFTNEQLESMPSNLSTSPVVKYKVVYAFDARNPDELTINPGDIISGLDGVHEPGWLLGELNGQKGLFPEAYVERITEPVQDQPEAGKSRLKRAEVATVIANYRALGQEQLNLEKGQLVLIRRKMDSGWWEGEIQVKGKKKQFGWFPASYVKLLSINGGSNAANTSQ